MYSVEECFKYISEELGFGIKHEAGETYAYDKFDGDYNHFFNITAFISRLNDGYKECSIYLYTPNEFKSLVKILLANRSKFILELKYDTCKCIEYLKSKGYTIEIVDAYYMKIYRDDKAVGNLKKVIDYLNNESYRVLSSEEQEICELLKEKKGEVLSYV